MGHMGHGPTGREIHELDFSSCIVVWSLRCAIHKPGDREKIRRTFAAAFGVNELVPAMAALDQMVAGLRCGAREGLEIPSFEDTGLSDQEGAVLETIAAIQARKGITAYRLIGALVRDGARAMFTEGASELADILAKAGHTVAKTGRRRAAGIHGIFAQQRTQVLSHASRVEELRPQEVILVKAMRLWVHAYMRKEDARAALQEYFALNGLKDGTESLNTVLLHASIAAVRTIVVHCPKCEALSMDEARLLSAVAAMQRDDQATAKGDLTDWVPPAVARLTLPAITGLAGILKAARVVLPQRAWTLDACETAGPTASSGARDREQPAPTLH